MSLVGSIVERTPGGTDTTSLTPFPVSADPKTGFPAAAHRSQRQRKSAFRQNREAARPLKDGVPIVLSTRPTEAAEAAELAESTPELTPIDTESAPDPNWRSTMEAENARRVAEMSTEEREDELRELSSKFGDLAKLAEVLGRAKDSKPRSVPTSPTIEEITDEESVPPVHPSAPILPVHNPQHRVASPPRPVLSRRGSVTGSSRAPSGLSTPAVRFAEVTPRDVFTYPSAPTSPKRAPLGIELPPTESGEDVPKVKWKGKLDPDATPTASPPDLKLSTGPNLASTGLKPPGVAFPALSPLDNATPEAIRRQYFPNESANNPNLEWIADLPEIPDTPVTSDYAYLGEKAGEGAGTRFNLAGTPIPREVGKEMPVHDGLHHNARTSAGKQKSGSVWVWACKAGVGAVCVGVAAAVSWKAAL